MLIHQRSARFSLDSIFSVHLYKNRRQRGLVSTSTLGGCSLGCVLSKRNTMSDDREYQSFLFLFLSPHIGKLLHCRQLSVRFSQSRTGHSTPSSRHSVSNSLCFIHLDIFGWPGFSLFFNEYTPNKRATTTSSPISSCLIERVKLSSYVITSPPTSSWLAGLLNFAVEKIRLFGQRSSLNCVVLFINRWAEEIFFFGEISGFCEPYLPREWSRNRWPSASRFLSRKIW